MMTNFDWHSAPLDDETVIDAGYRSTQNVRRYFRSRLGDNFAFSRPFMGWMKTHSGETLGTACDVWRKMREGEAR
ncbi:MAG: DUF6434 domain-containing protein [Paracoccaceae bacterium]